MSCCKICEHICLKIYIWGGEKKKKFVDIVKILSLFHVSLWLLELVEHLILCTQPLPDIHNNLEKWIFFLKTVIRSKAVPKVEPIINQSMNDEQAAEQKHSKWSRSKQFKTHQVFHSKLRSLRWCFVFPCTPLSHQAFVYRQDHHKHPMQWRFGQADSQACPGQPLLEQDVAKLIQDNPNWNKSQVSS